MKNAVMDDTEDTSSFRVSKLQNASCAEEEILSLQKLRHSLTSLDDERTLGEIDCETEWLQRNFEEVVNPFPRSSPENCALVQEDLDEFTFYLLERRFGWSEFTSNIEDGHSLAEEHSDRGGFAGSVCIQDESKFKGKLNELLDEFLKWYLAQAKLSVALLKSFKFAVSKAHNMPVVRNQTFVHIMDWLKHACSINGINSKVFPLVMDVLTAGITDIWSAIRNTCVAKLSKFVEVFTLSQVEEFYNNLVQLCLEKETSWQAKEGAVMCMAAIVCQFLWCGTGGDGSKSKLEEPQYMLKFGTTVLAALPEFIMSSVHSVLFSLLHHPQLSIREHATKAMSAILSRCEFEVALLSFQEVINRLCQGTQENSNYCHDQITGFNELPHHAVFRQHFKFIKAHEAEGLLGVCIFLIKHIPCGYLLPKWPLYFSTLNLYLMHPASTVRQATSVAFKYLVAKDSDNPFFLKLVLHGLAADWKVDKELLMSNLASSLSQQGVKEQLVTSAANTSNESECEHDVSHATEKQIPLQSTPCPFSNSDHCSASTNVISINYTGNEAQSASSLSHTNNRASPIPPFKAARTSIRQVSKLLAGRAFTSADLLMSESWEWREGRLLAYELILKFLITNHIHYVFPTFVLPVSKTSASSSADETLMSRSRSVVSGKTSPLNLNENKSHSFGVISSTAATLHTTATIKEGETGSLDKRHATDKTVNDCKETISKKKAKRAASCAGVSRNVQTQQLIRQYSVTVPQISPKRPFRLPRKNTLGLGNSLLNQTKSLDSEDVSSDKDFTEDVMFQCLTSPFGWSTSQSGDKPSNRMFENLSTSGEELPAWTNDLQLGTLSSVLRQVLLQTIECLADTRWELRRMGQQVLPLVTEVIRWFDIKPLEILWDNYLSRKHTLLCYGSCIALRYSILHAGRLMHFLEQPPSSWKDPESCGRAALTVVTEIQCGLNRWLSSINGLLIEPFYDKLSVVAMQVVMMAHICFPRHDHDQKINEEEMILKKILFLHMQVYPSSPLGAVLKKHSNLDVLASPFNPPTEGFLSFSARAASAQQHAQQASKFVISEIHAILPRFLKESDADQLIMLFPVLVRAMAQFVEDSSVCRDLLDCLCIILRRVEEMHMQGVEEGMLHSLVQSSLDSSFLGLSDVINTKELELQIVREVLEMFIRVCIFVERPTFLSYVFKAIISRMDYEPDLVRLMSEEEGSTKLTETPDLLILSNDIPTSPTEELVIAGEEEEDPDDKGRVMQESVALDTSHESGRGTTHLSSPEPGAEKEEFSDWDSWEDENENETALMQLFSEFLHQISQVYQSRNPIGHSIFRDELLKCGETEQKAIDKIMEFQG
ncbi:uncharacterized protein [Acropora muricata]|uniref:uncharacterized protein isoform X2 n=1 Tax=Acropora muricata TaxID=159855 RepID=UPI0034E4BA68